MSTFHFHQQPFTSTLHRDLHKPPINLWIIMVTASFFFLILSVYNFALALYNYLFNFEEQKRDIIWNNLVSSFWFILFWLVFAISFYFFLYFSGYLEDVGNTPSEHPLSKDEVRGSRDVTRDISRDVTQDISRI